MKLLVIAGLLVATGTASAHPCGLGCTASCGWWSGVAGGARQALVRDRCRCRGYRRGCFLVRRLAAVETVGSADVIASDKTGTLTRNELTVRIVVTASGRATFTGTGYALNGEVHPSGKPDDNALPAELMRALTAADRANNAVLEERDGRWVVQGDPTEGALIVAA